MSTRSRIAMKTPTGYRSIYCHNDGHLDRVGATLARHYKTDAKVAKLISMGNMSALGRSFGKKHDFDMYPLREDICTFYKRDRGQTGELVDPIDSPTLADLWQEGLDTDAVFIYLWENGGWSYVETRPPAVPPPFLPLVVAVESAVEAVKV